MLLTLSVGILLHLFIVFINISVRYCWPTNEFWHAEGLWLDPYNAFTIIYWLCFSWGVVELLIALSTKIFRNNTIGLMLSFFVLMTVIGTVQLTMGEYLEIQEGKREQGHFSFYLADYLYDITDRRLPLTLEKGDIPYWKDYVFEQSCARGWDPNLLTGEQNTFLREKHQKIIDDYMEAIREKERRLYQEKARKGLIDPNE